VAQYQAWENEYINSKLVTKKPEPQKDVLRFFKYLKKEEKVELTGLNILDLGCGTGRNSNHLAELGNTVVGVDISKTAIDIAKSRANEMKLNNVSYVVGDIGASYPFTDNYFDLVLDITSSNSLNEKERDVYVKEVYRTLKKDGYFFVRALCKDGDKNAKNLLKLSQSKEYDTYVIKDLGLTERVFSEKDFKEFYSKCFKIKKLFKKSGYAKFQNQSYKRNYWLAYIQKSD
jgi:ubiquinone/menaquinone biosynthesis C-methylase UbiE